MSEVVLGKSINRGSSINESKNKLHGIPCFRNGSEISRQFEWLKRRDFLISCPNIARTKMHWPLAFACPEDLTNACLMENKKAAVSEKLQHAIEKLKDVRTEIHEALLAALEMKEASDDIADQIMVAMVAQANIRNAVTTMGQAQLKIEHHKSRPRNASSQTKVEKMSLQTKKYGKPLKENGFYSIMREVRKKDLSMAAGIVALKDVPLDERRREAEKPLYLARYE